MPKRFLLISDTMQREYGMDIHVAAFGDVSAELLQQVAPDVVVTELVAGYGDALDVAALLYACGYGGRFCVLARALPDPDVIRADIARVAPDLAVDLLLVS